MQQASQRKRDYPDALAWIVRERGGGGGHPPRNVNQVTGWKLVQFTAFMFDKPVQVVAADLIDLNGWSERPESFP